LLTNQDQQSEPPQRGCVAPEFGADVTWCVSPATAHLAWYHHLQMRFRAYQVAVAAYAQLSGHRAPARFHVGTLRP
jgi:hypothetical protein